jgi:ribosomal-protein-alanine acetyltransferase
VLVRPATEEDRGAIAAIQQASPEAAGWDPAGYDIAIAELDGCLVGFVVTRRVAVDEMELLNLAVAPEHRRKGVARALLRGLLDSCKGMIFLEVRESNAAARTLYQSVGFKEVNCRAKYYSNPQEAGIVMKFHSC